MSLRGGANLKARKNRIAMERKILIVEDSQVLALAYSLPFLRKGYRVEMAGDGRQAIQLLRSFAPDVVLLDLVLPKVRGSVILEAIRSNPDTEKLPVIVFTSSLLMPGEEVRIRKLANRFLHKAQTSPEEVVHVVDEILKAPAAAMPAAAGVPEPAPIRVESPVSTDAEEQVPTPLAEPLSLPDRQEEQLTSAPALLTGVAKRALEAPSPLAPEAPTVVEPPPPVKAAPRSPDNVAGLMQEIESLTRRLLTEQSENGQGALLADVKGRLQRLDETLPRNESGAFGRLLAVFDDLVANLIQNRKDRSSSAIRTLMQACPVLQKIFKLNQTTGRPWQPVLTKTLIVDDSLVSLKTVARSLESISLSCESVSDPLEAITRLTASPFDLLVLDVDMPQMSGTDMCKKLRSLPRHAKTPVIFLTSLNRFDVRVTTARVGGDDFVTKPFLHPELAVKALTHIFRRHLDSAQS